MAQHDQFMKVDNLASPKHRPISRIPSIWKSYLYQLQQQAPTPRRIVCHEIIPDKPPHYGREFHGKISREEAEHLLYGPDGGYLVRESPRAPGQYTLSMRFGGTTKHFRLYYDGAQHYVGEKRFDTVHDLVYDGLISLHVEAHAREYIASMCAAARYEDSPYMTLRRRHLEAISSTAVSTEAAARRKARNRHSLNCQTIIEDPINVKEFEKMHHFKVHNFMGLNWCDFCGNFMWGLIAQGVRCEDCGLNAHRRCSENLPNDCCPDLKLIRQVFGTDLTALVKAHNTVRPLVVDLCIQEIEKRGLDVEGLYRVSGFSDDIEALRVAIDKDMENIDLSEAYYEDIHVITGVLKLYFRLLPLPLITFEAYPNFMSAIKQTSLQDKLECARLALTHLPPAHYQTLKFLMAHLNKVARHHSTNLMTAHNLSTVFCPTLMRSAETVLPAEQLTAWQQESALIEILITHQNVLFEK